MHPPTHMPTTLSEFLKYNISKAPDGCLNVVLACAADGQSHWQALFAHGLINAIAEDVRLERLLLRHLCIDTIHTYGKAIFGAYLTGLSSAQREQLLSAPALQDKNHPANHIFSKAAFPTTDGALALELLGLLIDAGLQGDRLQELATRRHKDVQRACRMENQAFLHLLFCKLHPVPPKLLRHVVADAVHGQSLVANLVQSKTVPLEAFTDPRVIGFADREVETLLIAMDARAHRTLDRFAK